MGLSMAKRLVGAGFTVKSAIHRSKEAGDAFSAAGGVLVSGFPEVVKGVDLILTIVSDDEALLELYGNRGFYQAVPDGVIILEMTSCAPRTVKKIAKDYESKTRNFVDAPVSGGVAGAASGGLTIFAAGEASLIDNLEPVLKVLGKTVRLDAVGDGKAVKAVNQMLAAMNMVAIAEAYALAKKLSLDLQKTYEIIKESSGGSYVFTNKFPKVVKHDFSGGFKFRLMKKDLVIAREEAKGLELPFLELAGKIYDDFKGNENADYSVLSTLYGEGN